MKERPILMSAPMVRAILAGQKSQTRRIGKIQNPIYTELGVDYVKHAKKGLEAVATYRAHPGRGTARWGICACPYGVAGDQLWVKETWAQHTDNSGYGCVCYRATCPDGSRAMLCEDEGNGDPCGIGKPVELSEMHPARWKPSIFMPRWASRITLELTAVRVERLQDISTDDAEAEGALSWWNSLPKPAGEGKPILHPKEAYERLWDSINLENGCWNSNPWVFVLEFRRV